MMSFKIDYFHLIVAAGKRDPVVVMTDCRFNGPKTEAEFDIVVGAHYSETQRISRLYPCYIALQLALLFIYGEQGYHTGLRLLDVDGTDPEGEKRMSMNAYYAYQSPPNEYKAFDQRNRTCLHCCAILEKACSPFFSVGTASQYELPKADNIGAIVFDDTSETRTDFDIILEAHSGEPQRINKVHAIYMSAQFPLLFLYHEHGYHIDLMYISVEGLSMQRGKRCPCKHSIPTNCTIGYGGFSLELGMHEQPNTLSSTSNGNINRKCLVQLAHPLDVNGTPQNAADSSHAPNHCTRSSAIVAIRGTGRKRNGAVVNLGSYYLIAVIGLHLVILFAPAFLILLQTMFIELRGFDSQYERMVGSREVFGHGVFFSFKKEVDSGLEWRKHGSEHVLCTVTHTFHFISEKIQFLANISISTHSVCNCTNGVIERHRRSSRNDNCNMLCTLRPTSTQWVVQYRPGYGQTSPTPSLAPSPCNHTVPSRRHPMSEPLFLACAK
ncbi:hypothetical protein CTI12_AA062080 [Artemisia annua]|uniref:Uncharacterized protein n=1 Tax=Artemisia annua TaxID=35608 RepID=A0A2U1Q8T9_ARTAN|nr:hypothetical protein CTI12_AA062080 [Artemisia annua]